eukprot:gene10830-22592_t
MSSLSILTLKSNKLTRSIPTSFGKFSTLQILSLSFNSLVGIIPSELGTIPLLLALELGNNKLTGPIPSNFCASNDHIAWALYMFNIPSNLCYPACLASQANFNKGSTTQCAR